MCQPQFDYILIFYIFNIITHKWNCYKERYEISYSSFRPLEWKFGLVALINSRRQNVLHWITSFLCTTKWYWYKIVIIQQWCILWIYSTINIPVEYRIIYIQISWFIFQTISCNFKRKSLVKNKNNFHILEHKTL